MEPNDFNEHMAGRHETGNVGFIIDENTINDLSNIVDLEIRDVDTDILVYRRVPSHPIISENLFRLETQLFPLWRLDTIMKNKFRFWYQRIEQFSTETVRQILAFHSFGSLYSSGRISYSNFDFYIYKNQKTAMLMQDPYDELAERLLIFNRLGTDAKHLLGERDALIFEPIITLSGQFRNFDEDELRLLLNKADPQILSILSNPVTRQLTSSTPDEPADRSSVAKSLQVLGEFDIVGLRSESQEFFEAIAELLGFDASEIPALSENSRVQEVAQNLRAIRWLGDLIEKDLELYHHIKSAFDSVHG
jgi:hypothetical protein